MHRTPASIFCQRIARQLLLFSLCASLALATASFAEAPALKAGKLGLQSIGALEFGPGNILFLGDSQGAAVHAIEVSPPDAGKDNFETIPDLDTQLASLLGAGVRDIEVEDMAVHEPTGTFYLSVTRGKGDKAMPALVQISRKGELSVVDLGNIPHDTLAIGNAPAKDAKLYNLDSRTLTITDLEYIEDELFIAGLSNEEFASSLRRTPFPFNGDVAATGLEIYHGAHGEYETFAPIFSFIPYEIEGKTQLLAGYLCTPLVTFPLDEIRKKDRLRGKTIAELGWGNIPTDLVPFESRGESWVLIINTRRGNMRVKASDIAAAQKKPGITTRVDARAGIEDHTVPLGAIAQAAAYGTDQIALLGRSVDSGALSLGTVQAARL